MNRNCRDMNKFKAGTLLTIINISLYAIYDSCWSRPGCHRIYEK